ncbi:PREDICTED: MLO-like protein 12 isoform X2 [Ipomoea nil]|uniref:MLO-like protein 12 isoform X2 n=1 Tax=Ipomoea nil TaxID=35883 RepID=UPI000901CFB5|nr:PREDICTED: MLO-like protein 12 isoform X2 [Ipomoea nil]
MAGGAKERTMEATPTWAIAVVCFVLIAISIAIEQLFHHLGALLLRKQKKALHESLEKIKSELMLMGFISLLLTIFQDTVSNICVPKSVGNSWHPCHKMKDPSEIEDPCKAKGKVQFASAYAIHQLHIFIFALAVTHVVYCITTWGLGKLKMRSWKDWEHETKTLDYQFYHDPERFRFARDTTFVQRHSHFWNKSSIFLWIACFFRQFFGSVAKVDYITLRHGFVMAHLPPQNRPNFDFQMYISLALEEDIKEVVEISPVLWLFAVLSFLTNTNGWYSYLWLPFIPLFIILVVGAKLQVIITNMGMRIKESGDVVKGAPVVEPGDNLFWFNRPSFMLFLIHFVLFQNAFQVAFFFWSWYKFGVPSCFHKNVADVAIRLSMGVIIHFLCSYVTLPLYALVNQMGSSMKPVIFGDNVASAIKNWRHAAKYRAKHGHGRRSEHASPLHGSPVHLLSEYQQNSADHDDADDLVWANSGGTSAEPHRNLSQEKGPAAGAMEISIK